MDKLIDKLKNGYKICLNGASTSCLQFSTKDNFVGTSCRECHLVKSRVYNKIYSQQRKLKQEKVFGALTLNNKEWKDISDACKRTTKKPDPKAEDEPLEDEGEMRMSLVSES